MISVKAQAAGERPVQRAFHSRYLLQIVAVFTISVALLLFAFDPLALTTAFVFAMITGYAMGIFHHMLFSHQSFRAKPWVENLGALLGTLTWRGPMAAPIRYAALHRVHHEASDRAADPHSPVHGLWHGFMGWMWRFESRFENLSTYQELVPRLASKPFLRFLDRNVDLVQALFGIATFAIASVVAWNFGSEEPLYVGIRFALYLVFLKTAFVLVLANAVDIVNHGIGYRNFETGDRSTNSALMGVIHLGGAISWHNNHHAKPRYFTVKKQWWEIDLHYALVKMLERLGLTSNIKVWRDERLTAQTLAALHQKSSTRAFGMIFLRISIWFAALAAMIFVMAQGWSLWLLALPALMIVSAVALQNLALVGHDGTHFNLSKSRRRSIRIGNAVAALVPFHLNLGFAVHHAEHHRHTNTRRDPDVALFRSFDGIWSRLSRARGAASRAYLKKTLQLARGVINEQDLRTFKLGKGQLIYLARENLLLAAISVAFYVGVALALGWVAVLALGLAFASGIAFSGIRPFLEHAGTNERRETAARSFHSPLIDIFFGGINYHDAHHRYPGVPSYRAKALHRYLEVAGDIGEVTTSSTRELFQVLRLPYGQRLTVNPDAKYDNLSTTNQTTLGKSVVTEADGSGDYDTAAGIRRVPGWGALAQFDDSRGRLAVVCLSSKQ